ncbi:MAG: GNAT family N-acetyltransferase, partial [Candidatus Nanopelagicales bacterium]
WAALLSQEPPDAAEGYPTLGDLVMARLVADGDLEAGEWGPWQVRELATGLLIGGAGFKGAPSDEGVVELGYGRVEMARGRGLATEAVQALVQQALGRGVSAVVAETDIGNEPSIGVLLRCGFVETKRTESVVWWRRG